MSKTLTCFYVSIMAKEDLLKKRPGQKCKGALHSVERQLFYFWSNHSYNVIIPFNLANLQPDYLRVYTYAAGSRSFQIPLTHTACNDQGWHECESLGTGLGRLPVMVTVKVTGER